MTSVQRASKIPPPTCPICGEPGRGNLSGTDREFVGNYICRDGHIYIVRAFRDVV